MMTETGTTLTARIDDVLPQTQCRQCGFHACWPYAEAMARDAAAINRCPPGGQAGIAALAALLDHEVLVLDPECGIEKPRVLARIIEADCIGCTKCIQACPVDAIVGSGKLMHTVIADQCTGCELCIPACPVDCIVTAPATAVQQDRAHADAARRHFNRREARLARECAARAAQLAEHKAAMHTKRSPCKDAISRSEVMAAITRGKARRTGKKGLQA